MRIGDCIAMLIEVEQAAEIAEDATGDAQLLRQTDRKSQRDCANIIDIAAERIVGLQIARADAAGGEAAQIVAADEEAILDAYNIIEALDVSSLAGQAQHVLRRQRIEITAAQQRADIADVATEAGEVDTELSEISGARIKAVVTLIIEQHLTD